jgi:AcrR family transcriptional regulator
MEEESTRQRIVAAAVRSFASVGYDGVSVREIERSAGVNRGLAAYHFGTKEDLWKAAVGWLMDRFHDEFERYRKILPDLPRPERQRVLYTVYARFSVNHPEYFRLLMLEGQAESERSRWLVDAHIRPALDFFNRVGGRPPSPQGAPADAIAYFLIIAAAASAPSMPALPRLLFGVDPDDSAVSEHFVRAVAELGMVTERVASETAVSPGRKPGRRPPGSR